MKRSDRRFQKDLRLRQQALLSLRQEEHLQEVVRGAKTAFYAG